MFTCFIILVPCARHHWLIVTGGFIKNAAIDGHFVKSVAKARSLIIWINWFDFSRLYRIQFTNIKLADESGFTWYSFIHSRIGTFLACWTPSTFCQTSNGPIRSRRTSLVQRSTQCCWCSSPPCIWCPNYILACSIILPDETPFAFKHLCIVTVSTTGKEGCYSSLLLTLFVPIACIRS